MIGYYQIIDTITEQLKQDVFCKTVTSGSIYNIATNKQSIYPISHIIVNSFADIGTAFSYNISVISMDLVTEDGANEQDVMHTQSMVGIRLCELLKRGDITDQNYVIEGNPSYEFFTDRFENKVAGCTTTFNVTVPNDMTIC
jgi:hypothetical protein